MINQLVELFRTSTIPGFPVLFSLTSKPRQYLWILVLIVFLGLTTNSLIQIVLEFLSFPIIVNVLVADSRVLPFPAVTICNLNPVHRSRFCAYQDENINKPVDVESILCANLDKMLDLCEISSFLNELLDQGREICLPNSVNRRPNRPRPINFPFNNSTRNINRGRSPISLRTDKIQPKVGNNSSFNSRRRLPRGLSLREFIQGFRMFISGDVVGLFNSTGLLTGLGVSSLESGSFIDTAIIQLAKIYGINIKSSDDLIPALFLKGFADITGCRFGSVYRSNGSVALEATLRNITDLILNSGCIWKLPRLFSLFQNSSERLLNGLSSCTAPWVRSVLRVNSSSEKDFDQSESPWYILLDLLQSWLADLSRHHLSVARQLGHQSSDLIVSCHFAGKKCYPIEFESIFSSSYGNCYTYNMAESLISSATLSKPSDQKLSGFTGPKFGLELVLNLEVDQYMPTSRETGAKIVIHDRSQKADPDQDAVHVPPGVVTYVGIQLINITRLPAPYRDKCSDDWVEGWVKEWAMTVDHGPYTSQFCLKLCLQTYTLKECNCWTVSAPPPYNSTQPQCDLRKNPVQVSCVERVREKYYAGQLICNCPPRCNEKVYEKFISTGVEAAQCSALSSGTEESSLDHKENIAKVIIYYQTLSFTEITQDVKYTWSSIIGAVGGILGAYLGFSFIAIYEFFEILTVALIRLIFPPKTFTTKIKTRIN
uniref:Uncharacterized protein n=1 Tax=Tetranychus urticae TaxID=32264 RepID=T1KCT8_TETUR